MKVFWAILVGSFMIASAIVFTGGESEPQADRTLASTLGAPETSPPADRPSAQMTPPSPSEVSTPAVVTEPDRDPDPDLDQESAAASEDDSLDPLNLDELLGIEDEPNRITPEMAIEDLSAPMEGPRTLSQQATAEFAELALQASGSVEEATRIAGSISPEDQPEVLESGLKIGKVSIPGTGTEADPYELPWGVLISAIRTYNPRLELNELPSWAGELDDKYVRLTGFAFLPVVASETDEILLMLNPWDGCHMGAPPTPYDSVEVMLSDPVDMGGRNGFVSVTGRFNVDPYLLRGWLVSLYTMDEARLEFAGS